MITVSYSHNLVSNLWIVYGTRVINGNPVTRPFESFKTETGAKNYVNRYRARQDEYHNKKRG